MTAHFYNEGTQVRALLELYGKCAVMRRVRRQRTSHPAPKNESRAEACRRWPSQSASFARVKDDGRAEAALIAVAGMAREAAGK